MESKTCCRCLKTKPLSDFNLVPQAACKACINIYQAAYRERNKEKRRRKQKELHDANPEKYREKSRAYRAKHQEELNAAQRVYSKRQDRLIADRLLRRKYEAELPDWKVRRRLCKGANIDPKLIPAEIIELKRLQLKLKRIIKENS